MEPNPLSRRLEELAALVGDEPEADAPASGTPVAAVRGEVAAMRADLVGQRVGIVISGGNVDLARFCALAGA